LHHASQAHSDDSFRIDGQELTTVTFVGVIRNVSESATSTMYTIEDGTGKIDVRKWYNRDEDISMMQKRSNLREGVYVRVVGELRAFQDQKSVTGNHIGPLDDFNEITYHFLEVIHLHLLHTRSQKGQQAQNLAFGFKNVDRSASSLTGNKMVSGPYTPQPASAADPYQSYDSEFTPLQSKVRHGSAIFGFGISHRPLRL
jgi:replication factor A2